jgi:hypothetical protein
MPKARWIGSVTALACGAILTTVVGFCASTKKKAADVAEAAARPTVTTSEPSAHREAEFPLVEGRYSLTSNWSVSLPGRFKRRVDEGDMYLWRPGLTLVVAIWNNSEANAGAQLGALKAEISRDAYDLIEETQGELARLAYRLHEAAEDQRQDAFYAFVVGNSSYAQLAVYFDDARDVDAARTLWRSVAESAPARTAR